MSTFIHGVASCSAIDTSGEVVDINGLDITSLARTGTINWEHNMGKDANGKSIAINLPAQVVGKILKAKKIFSQKDCSDDSELYFWNRTKLPFVYILAELLDDYCDSAKECAGKFKYSQANPNQEGILGFSVEGSEIPGTRVNKMLITRSIARKVTLTVAPANKACVAEILDNQKPQIKDDFDEIFKSEAEAITLFKSGEGIKIYENYLAKKESDSLHVLPVSSKAPKTFGKHPKDKGHKIGTTSTKKDVFSHAKIGEYGFNSGEHKEAGEMHRKAAVSAPNAKLADTHIEKMKLHNQAAITAGLKEKVRSPDKDKMVKSEHICELHKARIDEGRTPEGKASARSGRQYRHLQANINTDPKTSMERRRAIQAGSPGKHGEKIISSGASSKRNLSGVHGVAATSSTGGESVGGNAARRGLIGTATAAHQNRLRELKSMPRPNLPKSEKEGDLKKAIDAGSYNAAPSTLTNGAAYQSESIGSKQATTGAEHSQFQATKKKDWNKRAKDDYNQWPHRERFEKFMSARMPHLKLGEIQAIGRTLALKKSVDLEKSLEGLVPFSKSENHPNLGSHFLFSAENPMHPHKNELKMDHKQTLAHLKNKGFEAHEVKGHYGSPETSIMVHNVSPEKAEHLHGLASKLGQYSSIYSHGGKHEMRFHHGENAGKKVSGEGTVWHNEKPKDFYTTMPNGKHFTHNFNF